MVERQLPKLHTWVRFPSPAPTPSSNPQNGFAESVPLVSFLCSHLTRARLAGILHLADEVLQNFVLADIAVDQALYPVLSPS
jgi:hypothetical protein